MKVAIIGDSSVGNMPYYQIYYQVLENVSVDYRLINWDRLRKYDNQHFQYVDNKDGHKRNALDYYLFVKYIKNVIHENQFDKLIVFGIPIAIFLSDLLINEYRNRYIIDIRDYHIMMRHPAFTRLIDCANMVAISSPGFKNWLPKSREYIISHNSSLSVEDKLTDFYFPDLKGYSIDYIGTIRDHQVNRKMIIALRNSEHVKLSFHGDGPDKEILEKLCLNKRIGNVVFNGRYEMSDEEEIYKNAQIVNSMTSRKDINSKTLLTNRLYNSVKYNRMVLVSRNTYMADFVKKYKIGVVVDDLEDIEKEIDRYLINFDSFKYNDGRNAFIDDVLSETRIFQSNLVTSIER